LSVQFVISFKGQGTKSAAGLQLPSACFSAAVARHHIARLCMHTAVCNLPAVQR
jgi:hypothetical protein